MQEGTINRHQIRCGLNRQHRYEVIRGMKIRLPRAREVKGSE